MVLEEGRGMSLITPNTFTFDRTLEDFRHVKTEATDATVVRALESAIETASEGNDHNWIVGKGLVGEDIVGYFGPGQYGEAHAKVCAQSVRMALLLYEVATSTENKSLRARIKKLLLDAEFIQDFEVEE